jgi:aconitate hydratase
MVNGMGVLGWGVGGIEAEAAMLGQPIAMLIPDVIGFKLTGQLPEGATATDLVLTVTQILRKKGVVGKFVEFFGPALDNLTVADRATIANMAPEYGATCGFFPVDRKTLDYLHLTGRDEARIELVEAYLKAQGMFRDAGTPDPIFTDLVELDMATVVPSLAGPKRPQDRVALSDAASAFKTDLVKNQKVAEGAIGARLPVAGKNYDLGHGDVVIAAITSCTNTSNPYVLVAAGLVARKARAKGLHPKPWVKTSLAPGSQVVTEYLDKSGLSADRGQQAVCRQRAFRQPQFRGPRASECAGQLSGEPAAGGGLRAARQHAAGHHHGTARHRHRWHARVSERCLAHQQGDRGSGGRERDAAAISGALWRGDARHTGMAGAAR